MYWYRYRKLLTLLWAASSSTFLFLLLSASVVSVFLSCSPLDHCVVDLDVLVPVNLSRTPTVVVIVPGAAHHTGTGTDAALVAADPCWQSKHMMLCI